jgi:hypothetical protein
MSASNVNGLFTYQSVLFLVAALKELPRVQRFVKVTSMPDRRAPLNAIFEGRHVKRNCSELAAVKTGTRKLMSDEGIGRQLKARR